MPGVPADLLLYPARRGLDYLWHRVEPIQQRSTRLVSSQQHLRAGIDTHRLQRTDARFVVATPLKQSSYGGRGIYSGDRASAVWRGEGCAAHTSSGTEACPTFCAMIYWMYVCMCHHGTLWRKGSCWTAAVCFVAVNFPSWQTDLTWSLHTHKDEKLHLRVLSYVACRLSFTTHAHRHLRWSRGFRESPWIFKLWQSVCVCVSLLASRSVSIAT